MTYTGKRIMAEGVDITEAVQILYDLVHGGMDWGSGMLDNEEMTDVIEFAIKMEWEPPPIPVNSPPMVELALRYPEHYVVLHQMNRDFGTARSIYRVCNAKSFKGLDAEDVHRGWEKISADRPAAADTDGVSRDQ